MSWWVWVLIGWALLAATAAVVLGLAIRNADRRELGDRDVDPEPPPADDD
ncbi:hypothetical protein JKP76_17550 [Blastococcus sp. TML/C7B]|nr:hypothetical protein [Blastococcus sp. TML/C7B]MBN1097674.1 hypothetical protein [Blastococcus sp. TML/C7B]